MKVWMVEYRDAGSGEPWKPWELFLTESLANMAAADLRASSRGQFRARVVEYCARRKGVTVGDRD